MSKKKKGGGGGAPAWMATFSDLMTQILVFFVFLFTMSAIDIQKAREALISFNQALGGLSDLSRQNLFYTTKFIVPYPETTRDINPGAVGTDLSQFQMEEALHDIMFFVKENSLEEDIEGYFSTDGNIEIQLKDVLLFDAGSASIRPESYSALKKIGLILKRLPNHIIIEGHTDNLPLIKGEYRSNWELSAARALSVTKRLIQDAKISPEKISIAGYGEYRPVTSNATAEGRALNRRVTIVIVKQQSVELY